MSDLFPGAESAERRVGLQRVALSVSNLMLGAMNLARNFNRRETNHLPGNSPSES